MEDTGTTQAPFAERYREWLREAPQPWPRLQRFIEQMTDKMQLHESGGRIQRKLPEDAHAVAELVYWFGQWLLGMGPAQICDNTVRIARACQAFLFAGEMNQRAISAQAKELLEELLEYTQRIETALLLEMHGQGKSQRLQHLAESMHHKCLQLPTPGYSISSVYEPIPSPRQVTVR